MINADPTTLVRNLYEAVNRRDVDALLDAFTEDAEWIQPGHSPVSGTHRGRTALAEFLLPLFERSLRIEPRSIWKIEDTLVVALSRVELAGEHADEIDILRIQGGRVSHGQHIGDTAMLERSFEVADDRSSQNR